MSVYETFHQNFTDALAQSYPDTDQRFSFRQRIIPTLISPYILDLKRDIRDQAERIVAAYFRLRQTPEWAAHSSAQLPVVPDPGNTSALMSYDFHIDENGALRLIEINTNASLSLLVDELHRFQKIENVFSKEFRSEILATFKQEFDEACAAGSFKSHELKRIGIVDENPSAQRLFIEFAMYQELFATAGWEAKFFDPSELNFAVEPLDLIYNRDTDFYFSAETSRALREAMMTKSLAITPHPYEYRLLGDKDRLLELSDDAFLKSLPLSDEDRAVISRSLIRTIEVKKVDPEWMWKERKGYFFKPRRSHGGKAVYRGSSTSRGTFQSILAGDYLAQEMVPPPVVTFEGEDEMKYDLRFYVYRGKIQLACSRLYRGQMTNSQSPGGGVAPIRWI